MADPNKTNLAAQVVYAAMAALEQNGGEMRVSDIYTYIEKNTPLSDYAKETIKSGSIRWRAVLQFFSIEVSKAGYIVKKNGVWHITDEGAKAFHDMDEIAFYNAFHSYYAKWSKEQPSHTEKAIESSDTPIYSIDDLKGQATKGIKDYIAQKNPYEFQEMVAALLRAMGYYTPFIAPKGKDGGIDIIAYQDPLGTTSPSLKVQVKHYPTTAIAVDVVRSLSGILVKTGEIGLLVSSGTFTSEAKRESRSLSSHIRLVDIDELIKLWVDYFPKMTEEDKALMPIIPIYFVKPNIDE